MSGREVAKAQMHATLAMAEVLRGISADLALIRQLPETMSCGAPPRLVASWSHDTQANGEAIPRGLSVREVPA